VLDPILGVEMASTGEVACLGHEINEAFLKAFISRPGSRYLKKAYFCPQALGEQDKFLSKAVKVKEEMG